MFSSYDIRSRFYVHYLSSKWFGIFKPKPFRLFSGKKLNCTVCLITLDKKNPAGQSKMWWLYPCQKFNFKWPSILPGSCFGRTITICTVFTFLLQFILPQRKAVCLPQPGSAWPKCAVSRCLIPSCVPANEMVLRLTAEQDMPSLGKTGFLSIYRHSFGKWCRTFFSLPE